MGTLMQLSPALPPLTDAGAAFTKFLERYTIPTFTALLMPSTPMPK